MTKWNVIKGDIRGGGADQEGGIRMARCTGCGLRWTTSIKTQIPKSGYICPHCESRLRAGEPLKLKKETNNG